MLSKKDMLLKIFDEKLAQCIEKIKQTKGLEDAEALAAQYQAAAEKFRNLMDKTDNIGLLALGNQTFDNLLLERSNDMVNEQFFEVAKACAADAKGNDIICGIASFCAVTMVVASAVFGLSLGGPPILAILLGVEVLLCTAISGITAYESNQFSEKKQKVHSFASTNRGLFSVGSIVDEAPQDEISKSPLDSDVDESNKGESKKMD